MAEGRGRGALVAILRSRLRADWRGLVALTVLGGLGFGVALAALGTSRRTAGAHDRFFTDVHAYNYSTGFGPDIVGQPVEDRLRSVPGLVEHQQIVGFDARPVGLNPNDIVFFFGWWHTVAALDRPALTAGRLPREDAADEVFITDEAARRSGLGLGGELRLVLGNPETFAPVREVALRVVGIGRRPTEIVVDDWNQAPLAVFSPAFVDANWDLRLWGNVWMVTGTGSSVGAVRDALGSLGLSFDEDRSIHHKLVWQSVRPLVAVVGVAGVLGFLATWVLTVPVIVRRRQRYVADDAVLGALGTTSKELRLPELFIAVGVGGLTALIAVGVALATSPLAPVGPFREVDPARGLQFDSVVVPIGAAAIVISMVAAAASAGRRRARAAAPRSRAATAGLPLPVRLGVDWAFGRHGSGTRMTAAIAAGVGLVVAAVVFVASLGALGERPRWYGQLWDAGVKVQYGAIPPDLPQRVFGDDPDVDGWTTVRFLGGTINGRPVPMVGFDQGPAGAQWPLVVTGREPRRAGEILVGGATLREIGKGLGDVVTLRGQEAEQPGPEGVEEPEAWQVTIVGTAIFPAIGYPGIDPPRLGIGLAMQGEELGRRTSSDHGDMVLFDLAPGVDPDAFVQARSQSFTVDGPFPIEWFTEMEPVEVREAAALSSVIWVIVGVVGLAAAGLLAYAVATAVGIRRRDHAILRALGFNSRQIGTTVIVQAFGTMTVMLMVALVAGVFVGRQVWVAFAERLDVLSRPFLPWLPLSAVVLATYAATAAVVAPLVWRARSAPVAQLLRAE